MPIIFPNPGQLTGAVEYDVLNMTGTGTGMTAFSDYEVSPAPTRCISCAISGLRVPEIEKFIPGMKVLKLKSPPTAPDSKTTYFILCNACSALAWNDQTVADLLTKWTMLKKGTTFGFHMDYLANWNPFKEGLSRQEQREAFFAQPMLTGMNLQQELWFKRHNRLNQFLEPAKLANFPRETQTALKNMFQTTSTSQAHQMDQETLFVAAVKESGKKAHGIRQTRRLDRNAEPYVRGYTMAAAGTRIAAEEIEDAIGANVRKCEYWSAFNLKYISDLSNPANFSLTDAIPLSAPAIMTISSAEKVDTRALFSMILERIVLPAFQAAKWIIPLHAGSFGHLYPMYTTYTQATYGLNTVRLSLGKWVPQEVIRSLIDHVNSFNLLQPDKRLMINADNLENASDPAQLISLFLNLSALQIKMQKDMDSLIDTLNHLLRMARSQSHLVEEIFSQWIARELAKCTMTSMAQWAAADYFYYYTKLSEFYPILLSLIPEDMLRDRFAKTINLPPNFNVCLLQSGMMALRSAAFSLSGKSNSHTHWGGAHPLIDPFFRAYQPYFEIGQTDDANAPISFDLREQFAKEVNLDALSEHLTQAYHHARINLKLDPGLSSPFILDITRVSAQLSDENLLQLFFKIKTRIPTIPMAFARSNIKYKVLNLDKYHSGEVWWQDERPFQKSPPTPMQDGYIPDDTTWALTKKLRIMSDYIQNL